MATELEYAELANRVYKRADENRTPVPEGWAELRWLQDPAYSGFSAGVYQKGGEIVISFTGTNEGKAVDFLEANIPLGLGATSPQVYQAMLLYFETKAQHPDAVVSFTGHSLGGGLASMMAVFFDKGATIFDAAPFELGARNPASLALTLATMTALGYTDPAFTAYVASAGLDFPAREQRVNAVSLESEILAGLRAVAPTIYGGTEKVVPIGAQTLLDATGTQYLAARTQLHSMTLLVAMLRSNAFAQAVQGTSQSLELFFDNKLYQRDPETSNQANFIDRLLLADMGNASAGVAGQPILDRFAADLLRIDSSAGMTAQPAVQRALTVAAMEYYYFKDPAQTTQLFTVADGGLHFDLDDIGQPQLGLKSPRLLSDSLKPFLSADEWTAVGHRLDSQDAWHLQAGASGMVWTAGTAAYDAAVGGAGTDVLDAGAGDDILIGGAGQDFLTGGSGADILIGGLGVDSLYGNDGNDRLMGGADADIYHFSGAFGSDVIEDADGAGVIQLAGMAGPLTGTGAKQTSSTTWHSEDKQVSYSLVQADATRQDLVIGVTGADSGSITIRNWTQGGLGITLGDEVAQPATTATLMGDIIKAINFDGTQYRIGADGNYLSEGSQPDAPDVFNGGAGAEAIFGLGGNDGISGGAGDDTRLHCGEHTAVSHIGTGQRRRIAAAVIPLQEDHRCRRAVRAFVDNGGGVACAA